MTNQIKSGRELESCPACGALPCDWVDNPFSPTPAKAGEDGDERAQIVAWLLRHADGELSNNYHVQRAAKAFAEAIERGDHLSSIEEPRG